MKKRGPKPKINLGEITFPLPIESIPIRAIHSWVSRKRKQGYDLRIMQDENGKRYLVLNPKL